MLENSEQLEVPEQLTDNQKKLLTIYEEFKKSSFDEAKIKDLILDLKTIDPNLETRLSEDVIWKSDNVLKFNFFYSDSYRDYTIFGLALRAGILSNEDSNGDKTLDCLKFLLDQNLVTKDALAIIVPENLENLSVLGVVIASIVRDFEKNVNTKKTEKIIEYYLEDKSPIEKAEAIVGYSNDTPPKEVTLSDYLVTNLDLLTYEDDSDKNAKSILNRFGLQFSDIFDERVKAQIYKNFYLTTLGVFVNLPNPQLKYMEFFLNEGANPNSPAQVNNDGSIVTIFDFALAKAKQSGNYEIPKILIKYGAEYGNLDEDINCPEEIRGEINKNKNTKSFFDGDIPVDLKDINKRFLKKLCKESGIPSHLLSETKEINADYVEIKEEFKKLASDSEKTLSSLLAEILHAGNQLDFPSSESRDLLDLKDFSAKDKEIYKITEESYKKNPHLTSAQFLKKDELDKKSLILFRDQEASNRFFEEINQLILPKEQLETLNELKEMYSSTPSHLVEVFSAQSKELMDVKQKLSDHAKELMDVKQKLSEKQKSMDLLKSETAEQKEERLTQEDLKKAAEGNSKKITDFFQKPEDTQAPSSLPLLAETSIEPEDTQAPSSPSTFSAKRSSREDDKEAERLESKKKRTSCSVQ
jgi:hypothetical protein